MQPTSHPHINDLLTILLAQMQAILKQKLVGLYLYGSLVTGDFDDNASDVDLLAAVSSDIDATEFAALKKMHHDIVLQDGRWDNRLEIAYLSLAALKTFKTQISNIAVISPGEPFHFKDAGKEWLVNWYTVREKGVTLFGLPPETIIPPISQAEFIQTVQAHIMAWRDWLSDTDSRPYQAYAILTLCRGLCTYRTGEQISKIQAAAWAAQQFPEWATLIQNALLWRQAWRETEIHHAVTLPETRRFIDFMIDQVRDET
jgi:predicted nucleotidyltransferase